MFLNTPRSKVVVAVLPWWTWGDTPLGPPFGAPFGPILAPKIARDWQALLEQKNTKQEQKTQAPRGARANGPAECAGRLGPFSRAIMFKF